MLNPSVVYESPNVKRNFVAPHAGLFASVPAAATLTAAAAHTERIAPQIMLCSPFFCVFARESQTIRHPFLVSTPFYTARMPMMPDKRPLKFRRGVRRAAAPRSAAKRSAMTPRRHVRARGLVRRGQGAAGSSDA